MSQEVAVLVPLELHHGINIQGQVFCMGKDSRKHGRGIGKMRRKKVHEKYIIQELPV